MTYEKDDFRQWLTSFEGDEQPFQERCPIATWQQKNPEFKLYFESLMSDWMGKFIVRLDQEVAHRSGFEPWTPDWSSVTAKECLELLDSLEVA